jgi:hypothetical protein
VRARRAVGPGRRRVTLRRFLFCTALLPLAAAESSTLSAQDGPSLRILERQIRLTLDEGGAYRVIDAMRVRLDFGIPDSLAPSVPLPLIVLQENAVGARGLGGDVAPTQVVREGNGLAVVGPIPRPTFEVGVTYGLPPSAQALFVSSAAAVDELHVFVDRGRIAVRPKGALVREEDVGSASQPSLDFVARDLAAGSALRIDIVAGTIGWRERFAVLLTALLAAAVAGVRAWRRAD